MRKRQTSEEYRPNGEDRTWRVGRFAEVCNYMNHKFTPKDLVKLHELGGAWPEQWKMFRMAYDINPLVPKLGADESFLKPFELEEIATLSGMKRADVEAQIDMIRFEWERYVEEAGVISEPLPQEAPAVEAASPPLKASEGESGNLATIESFGFSPRIFDVERSDDVQRRDEIAWFASRLIELEKAFQQPASKGVARQAILNELHMRRVDDRLCITPVESKDFAGFQKSKQTMEQIYARQWAQLEDLCPYLKAAKNKVNVNGVLSEFIQIVRDWPTKPDRALVDGLFTAYEVQVELRQSEQLKVRYRPGLVAAINEAKAGILDPNFRSKIPQSQLRLLDEAFRASVDAINEKTGVRLIDLEGKGPEDEFPPIFVIEDDIVAPESPVPLADSPMRA